MTMRELGATETRQVSGGEFSYDGLLASVAGGAITGAVIGASAGFALFGAYGFGPGAGIGGGVGGLVGSGYYLGSELLDYCF
jgi:S-DNA-T family DNA segregation ATPase FtsK/SpoIIIE